LDGVSPNAQHPKIFSHPQAGRPITPSEDYKAFEAVITADYDAQSAVERELVLRLASLLWRLRRATSMETRLFEIQADHLSGIKRACQIDPTSRDVVYALFGRTELGDVGRFSASRRVANETEDGPSCMRNPLGPTNVEFAWCFLRLANLPDYALDRLSRYEAILWRQVRQILIALDALNRRKPQDRGRYFRIGSIAPAVDRSWPRTNTMTGRGVGETELAAGDACPSEVPSIGE
jgi:hypothetical protein